MTEGRGKGGWSRVRSGGGLVGALVTTRSALVSRCGPTRLRLPGHPAGARLEEGDEAGDVGIVGGAVDAQGVDLIAEVDVLAQEQTLEGGAEGLEVIVGEAAAPEARPC